MVWSLFRSPCGLKGDSLGVPQTPFTALGLALFLPLAVSCMTLTSAEAALAPRLDFTTAEIAFAEAISDDPGLAAFYGGNDLKPVFTGTESRARREALLEAIETAPEHGLPAARYQLERMRAFLDAPGGGPEAEIAMARIFASWVHDVSAGVLDPRKVDPGIKRKGQGADTGALLREFATASDPGAVLARAEPRDPRYHALKEALARARGVRAPEGTPLAPEGLWRPGAQGPEITALRARLDAMGFASETPPADPAVFDEALSDSVRAFQKAVGLQSDGIAGPRTIERMNSPVGHGPRDLLVAMERLRWLPDDLFEGQDRYIWVNLPQYSAEVVEEDQTIFETRVVVGKTSAELQTPEFSDRMQYVVANPAWNVPRSITVKEYLPKLQQNRYAVAHLDVINSAGKVVPRDQIDFARYTAANFPYRMREKPSPGNALGLVKFLFPNKWNIYLHDTPTKWLFDQSQRAYSHGCIRIGRPFDLARLLLEGQVADPAATLDAALKGGTERYLVLKRPIPIHLVYFTTLPGADGTIRHFPDIYGRDARVWDALQAALEPPADVKQFAAQ